MLWCCRNCIAYARDVVQCCGVVESVLPMPGMLSSVVVLWKVYCLCPGCCPVLWCCRKYIAYARDVVQCCGVVETVLPMPGMLSSVVVL